MKLKDLFNNRFDYFFIVRKVLKLLNAFIKYAGKDRSNKGCIQSFYQGYQSHFVVIQVNHKQFKPNVSI